MLAIIKYCAGNVCSVVNALHRLGAEAVITDDPDELRRADRVIFPGQGEASHAMAYLRERGLDDVIRSLRQPVLGICIGQQLLCAHSDEGDVDCLGIFPDVSVRRFNPDAAEVQPGGQRCKVPHMGWNSLSLPERRSPLLEGVGDGDFVYFVHSFYVPVCAASIAVTDYICPFSAALQHDNFFATQFHPEKSGDVGLRILQNFLNL